MNSWKKWRSRNIYRTNSKFSRVGAIAEQMFPQVSQADHKGGELATYTFGNVWSRIWRNTREDGTVYYRISLHRIESKDGTTIVRNNFRPADLNDIIRTVQRCKLWFREMHN